MGSRNLIKDRHNFSLARTVNDLAATLVLLLFVGVSGRERLDESVGSSTSSDGNGIFHFVQTSSSYLPDFKPFALLILLPAPASRYTAITAGRPV